MDGDRMFALAQGLAAAKSRQDVAAALTFLATDMLLENPAFGTSVRGLPENERALTHWFKMSRITTSCSRVAPTTLTH